MKPSKAEKGPNVIAPPPLIFALPLIVGFVLDRLIPLPRLSTGLRLAGIPLLGVGVALAGWFGTAMVRAHTPIDVRDAPTALVTDGPFAYSRNPGYLALSLFYLGLSLVTGARWPLVFLPGVIATVDRGVVQREERYLEDRFGDAYRAYLGRVRRWL